MLPQPTSEESVLTSLKAKDSGRATLTVDDQRTKKVPLPVKTYSFEEVLQASLEYFGGDDLAARTFVTKYALQNNAGKYLEKTPTQLHRRLSKEFARIEAKYPNPMTEKEIFDLLDRFKYIVPQGSPMSGIGNDFKVQSISNCFIAGTRVLTVAGVKSIEDVQVGDRVVTHQGRVQKVVQTHRNELGDRQLFKIKAFRTPEITVTENHKFWSITEEQLGWGESPQWNAIGQLRKGDWLAIPNNESPLESSSVLDVVGLLDKLVFQPDSLTYTFDVSESNVIMASHWSQVSKKGNEYECMKDTRQINRFWKIDQDFAYFLGLWYGDGCVFNQDKTSARVRGITFTFGSHERELVGFVAEYGEQLFGIPADINEHNANTDHTIQVVFHSGLVGRVFEHLFGRSYAHKKFHESMFSWDKSRFERLLTGLVASDGTVTAQGDVRVVLGNEGLIDSFYHVARGFGMPLGRSSGTAKYNGETRTYARLDFPKYASILDHVHKVYEDDRIERARLRPESTVKLKEVGGTLFVRLDQKMKVNAAHDQVFTFGVEEDHSYSVEGLVAQNCFVIESPADSYGGILMTDQEQVQIMKRRGGVGFDLSTIRPKGLPTANAAQTTDGIEIFMDRFSNSCREVAQGGRRGALMLSLDVHHPQVRDFVKIKRDLTRVTGANISLRLSDEFMEAVEKGKKVQLRWPVEPGIKHTVEEYVDARELWTDIIESAHHCAEPGLLFWGTAKKYTPSDIYEDEGFGSVSTNPCFSGDTLIAVADGRNAVSIQQLAEEGLDVPVYSVDPVTGEVSVKTGRNPRLTGHGKTLLRVHLDSGGFLDVTEDHKFFRLDGTAVLAKDLKAGHSLPKFWKELATAKKGGQEYYRVSCDVRNPRRRKVYEHRLIAQFADPEGWAAKYDAAKSSGWHKGGLVVHHRDYNGLNNRPENLEIMTWKDHQQFHADHDSAGEKNGRFLGTQSVLVKDHALALTVSLGRKFTAKDWYAHAKANGLPQTFSKMHHAVLGKNAHALANLCAQELGLFTGDPRLGRTLATALEQGYEAEIVGSIVQVVKVCEGCDARFTLDYHRREGAYCSHPCALQAVNSDRILQEARVEKTRQTYKGRAGSSQHNQAKVWSDLQFQLGRAPMMKEWEVGCRNENVPYHLKTKFGFQSYREVSEAGSAHNHKVSRVEVLSGAHDVFNITVDDNHTLAVVTETKTTKSKNPMFSGVYVAQCGEILLSPNDSCRLMVINLASFVLNPFTAAAEFDWIKYGEVAQKAQRLMDDMIDLEIEQIDKILAKIEADPESDYIKNPELNLWRKIRDAAVNGRRTGLGPTAVGDAVAKMNLVYGSDESIEFVEQMYRAMAVGSYTSSVTMAKERGCFPVYNYIKEQGHPFLERIWEAGGSDLRAEYEKHGRRNIANTTTAPCGSVSIMCQTTSGIEPAYTLLYTRRKKINLNEKGAKIDFTDDMGDTWSEFTVRHHGFVEWQAVNGKTDADLKESPYFGGTSNDVDWVQKVKLQGAAQKWIDHAISNTTNLPSDTTVDTVKDVYMAAYLAGCKGATVYVDGSRSGVLVQNKFRQHDAPKRPARLACEVHRSRIKIGDAHEEWLIFVGMLEGKPFEIFGGTTENIELPKKVESGWIVKRSFKTGGKYDFVYGDKDDPTKIKDIIRQFGNPERGWATRMMSLALRHGSPIQFVVEQLQREQESDLFDFAKVVSRVLKRYIVDGTKPQSQKVCPECGEEDNLRYEGGCVMCHSCGAGKCP